MSASSHFDVIVVGGGPAGVAAAVEMRRCGVASVSILEREAELGGATRHCAHSPFGMLEFGRPYFGAAYGRRLDAEAKAFGVDIRTGHSVVRMTEDCHVEVATASGVTNLSADRIVIATGTRETPRSALLLPGDRPAGIMTTGTLQASISYYRRVPFRRPLIIGSELVSMSALFTCVTHGARPVAMVEPGPHLLARPPFRWFPRLVGTPVYLGAQVLDIRGSGQVSSVRIGSAAGERELLCDGVLLTGRFVPEAALFRMSNMTVDGASQGPPVDQDGRCEHPYYFSAGNVLRAVETGGWAFREGRSVGAAVARDLQSAIAVREPVRVEIERPIKLVVPSLVRAGGAQQRAMCQFQLRMAQSEMGRLSLVIDGKVVWQKTKHWLTERRILVPIPDAAFDATAVGFRFAPER
jgi:thioredoxin reductase